MSTVDYVKNIVKKNNIQRQPPPTVTTTPIIRDPMEKMASIIGIKNINWSEVRQHHNNNFAMKSNDGHEALAKSGVYAEARIRHAAILITATLKIDEERLSTICEAWSAKNTKSNILWIKADRVTIELICNMRNKFSGNPGISLKEYTSREFVELKNQVDVNAVLFKAFDHKFWTRITPGPQGTWDYKIKVSHVNDRIFKEVSYTSFMKIPDCSYDDLRTPSSTVKGNKRALSFAQTTRTQIHI